ncbi:MAG: tetratricopeptide repeat protein [Alphaproteobacteria bacterium]
MNHPAYANASRNDPCPCGSGRKFKKCCMEKMGSQIPTQPVVNVKLFLQQAGQLLNAGRTLEADAVLAQAMQASPKNIEVLNLKAYVCMQMGQHDEANDLVQRSLLIEPDNGLAYFIAGMTSKMRKRFDEMEMFLKKAAQLKPKGYMPQIYANLGDCLHSKRNLPMAIGYYDKALELDSGHAKAYFFRGMARYDMEGMNKQVEADAFKGISLMPRDMDMKCKLAAVYIQDHQFARARTLLEEALRINPDDEQALFFYGTAYQEHGDTQRAKEVYEELIRKCPHSVRGKIAYHLLQPTIPMSNAHIDEWRARLLDGMRQLANEGIEIFEPEQQGFYLPFYQGYHGRDNKDMMIQMADFFMKICPDTRYTAPHCKRPPQPKQKIKVGFVSELFHSKLITQFFGPIIEDLGKDEGFEVIVFSYSARRNRQVDEMSGVVDKYIMLPQNLVHAQQVVASEEMDVLIFLDIGMRLPSYLLALSRLAHIQAVMGGHPLTTGIPTMDVFFTTGSMEPEGAQAHYSEKLVVGADMLAVFKRDHVEEKPFTRADFGFPEDGTLYACPVLLNKLHVDMDEVFTQILTRDKNARIILFDEGKFLWRKQLEERFLRTMDKDLLARIQFLPFIPGDKFIHAMRQFDCIIDTMHFSFGTTAFLLIGSNVPFVTLPGAFLRGRGAYGLFKIMDMSELSADTIEEYAELAVKLANDKDFYKAMQKKISERSDVLFDNYEPVPLFKQHLIRLYGEACAS